jgi:hypothetical protein
MLEVTISLDRHNGRQGNGAWSACVKPLPRILLWFQALQVKPILRVSSITLQALPEPSLHVSTVDLTTNELAPQSFRRILQKVTDSCSRRAVKKSDSFRRALMGPVRFRIDCSQVNC